jgi:hypothetical protein
MNRNGCLCDCGHRAARHSILISGDTPCVDCMCTAFSHTDNDPECSMPKTSQRKGSKIPMTLALLKFVTLEPILGPGGLMDEEKKN